jgi:hypothetical protein
VATEEILDLLLRRSKGRNKEGGGEKEEERNNPSLFPVYSENGKVSHRPLQSRRLHTIAGKVGSLTRRRGERLSRSKRVFCMRAEKKNLLLSDVHWIPKMVREGTLPGWANP